MEIETITTVLKGKHDIRKLSELGYKEFGGAWIFYGRVHKYKFIPYKDKVIINIGKVEDTGLPLIPRITQEQMRSWVLESIERISQ